MRRSHVRSIGFDAAGISFILRELIEIGQSPAGAIDKEAQHLLEKFRYANAFRLLRMEANQRSNQLKISMLCK